MDNKGAAVLGICIIAAALIIALVPRPASRTPLASERGLRPPSGNLWAVEYMVQTSPSTAQGATLERVTEIEFFPTYVVLKSDNGFTKVLFNDKTQNLSWYPKPDQKFDNKK